MQDIFRASFPNKRLHLQVIEKAVPQTTLFLHGNAASLRWWQPSLEIWNDQGLALKPAILIDLPGCGESSDPDSVLELNLATLAHDIREGLRERRLEPLHLIGHSAGGLLGAYLLSRFPDPFRRALLLDPASPQGLRSLPTTYAIYQKMREDRELAANVIAATIYRCDRTAPFFQNVILADAQRAMRGLGYLLVQAMDRLDSREVIRKILTKTLVAHGEYDTLLPITGSEEFAALIPGGQFRKISQTGHCLNVENPKAFVDLANQFLFAP